MISRHLQFNTYKFLILLFGFLFGQVHFNDLPNGTGINYPVIIEQCLGLDIGDEIGLFDPYGLRDTTNCQASYGEILVGAGVYNGEQIEVTGIGSIDFCDLEGGYALPGWVDGNMIEIRVWDASEDMEYIPSVNYTAGGYWGDNFFSVIDVLVVDELSINIKDNFSLFNAYPNPFNPYITFEINDAYQDDINISVYNLLGNKIYDKNYNVLNNKLIVWNASDYDSGIYIVKFSNKEISFSKKITLLK